MYNPKSPIEKELFEALQNQELSKKLTTCKTPEECYEVTKKYISTKMTLVEYKEAMTLIHHGVEDVIDEAINDNDMESVAGGTARYEPVQTLPIQIGNAAASAI